MSNVPLSPRARERRRVQSNTPTKHRRSGSDSRMDRLSMSPGGYSRQNMMIPPRPVTPSNDMSWDLSKDRPAMNIIDRMPSTPPSRSYSSSRSVVSESAAIPFDEDMPDDEKHDTVQRLAQGFSRLHQPYLTETFEDTPLKNARLETQRLKKEVRRLTALLNAGQAQDLDRDHHVGNYGRPPSTPIHNVDAADRGGGAGFHHNHLSHHNDDDVSSLGGIEDCAAATSSLDRLTRALRSQVEPQDLSPEEKQFYGVVQSALTRTRSENQSKIRKLENDLHESSRQRKGVQQEKAELEKKLSVVQRDLQASKAVMLRQGESSRKQAASAGALEDVKKQLHELEEKNREASTQLSEQQTEHERAIRAIQRVLADVTTQRDTVVENLEQEIASLKEERENFVKEKDAVSSPKHVPTSEQDIAALRSRAQRAFALEREIKALKSSLLTCETSRDELQQELEQKGGKIVILEQELNIAKTSLKSSEDREDGLRRTLKETSGEVEGLKRDLGKVSVGDTGGTVNVNQLELETLRDELQEKRANLETAKNIIASLENANGSLTADLRGKLKDKEVEVTSLKGEMAHGKKTLDHLATELRDLQLQKKSLAKMSDQARRAGEKQQELRKKLENSLSELRSVAAVHEAETTDGFLDEDVVDQVSTVIGNLLFSLEASLSATQILVTSSVDKSLSTSDSDVGELDGNVGEGRAAASEVMQRQLVDQKSLVKNLEEALRSQKLDMDARTKETEEMRMAWEEEEAKLKVEIRSLQDQCMTNMQVLTKKERELEVLRDSLEVTDGVGYISDDGTDAEDEDENLNAMINRTMSIDSSHYSHSQAEAVATLLVHGGTGIEVTSGVSPARVDNLEKELKKAKLDKEKAAKDLKQEQEALSNAKMIISSLERANKTMLEDLRSRLQDSNTAIASLLEKSSQQEKKASSMQTELEQLKEEKEKDAEQSREELRKLKDEQCSGSEKLAEKEREVLDLTKRLQEYEDPSPESSEGEPASGANGEEAITEKKRTPPRPER